MKPKDKRGGPRPGSGRPRKLPIVVPEPTQDVDWAAVERFANVGASEEEIVAGLGISEANLRIPATSERLRSLVLRGNARKDLLLREAIDKLGKGEAKGGGNTLALEARNRLGWDKQNADVEPPPDLTSAHARLRLTLERLAKVVSEEKGREVSPAEVLFADVLPKKDEPIH
jgi:hypothetical protein